MCDFYHFCPQKKKNVCDGDSTTRDSNFLGFTPANAPIPLALAYLDFFFFFFKFTFTLKILEKVSASTKFSTQVQDV